MIVYIDNNYNCYASNDGTRRGFETTFFEGKCPKYIEGFKYVPKGERYVDEKGIIYRGEMCIINADHNELEKAQFEYDLAQYEAALTAIEKALGVTL